MGADKSKGAVIATAAALLFGSALVGVANAATETKLSCVGVNTCKGQSACKSARNDCKGQNACKGLGFVELTKSDCDIALAKTKRPAKKPA
jgi:hypothetical protein